MPLSLRESVVAETRLPRNDAILQGRASLLREEDRALVDAVLIRGQDSRSLAMLMGVSRRVVRYRLHNLVKRMTSQEFLRVARVLAYLMPADRTLARQWFCARLTLQEICEKSGMTYAQVRKRLAELRGEIRTICRHQALHRGSGGRWLEESQEQEAVESLLSPLEQES